MENNDGWFADIFYETVPATQITLCNNEITLIQIMAGAGEKTTSNSDKVTLSQPEK